MKPYVFRIFSMVLVLAFASAPHFTLTSKTNAQERNINVNEKLDFRALGIDNEAKQFVSLIDVQVKFFKRGEELRAKSILSPRDPGSFREDADKRKAELVTIKNQLESLINKLKQKNRWDDAFDAQFLVSLKNDSDRSVLSQFGGARKLFQSAVGEISSTRDEIDEEVRQVNSKQTGRLRNRTDRVFAAHASPTMGKICVVLLTAYFLASGGGTIDNTYSCAVAHRYNEKSCVPRLSTNCSN